MHIAIAGATGTVGTSIVRLAEAAGHEVRQISRSVGIDLTAPTTLDLSGIDVVIDASGINTTSAKKSRSFFETTTSNLLKAARAAGVVHFVALSIVRAAQTPCGYYAGKARQEELIEAGLVPWTILRSTQFFEFAQQNVVELGPWHVVPTMRCRPVAASTVAMRLLELATAAPLHKAVELAGPEETSMAQVLRTRYAAQSVGCRVVEIPLPGAFGRAIRNGSILPGPTVEVAGPNCAEWATTTSA